MVREWLTVEQICEQLTIQLTVGARLLTEKYMVSGSEKKFVILLTIEALVRLTSISKKEQYLLASIEAPIKSAPLIFCA